MVASFSRNTFDTISTARGLSHMLTSLLGGWVSTVKEAREQLQYIQQLLGTQVAKRRASADEKGEDFLQWCIDLARTEDESRPESLAHRTLGILSMAVVHTTAMASTHIMFDMLADESLKSSLRQEQESILQNGWTDISQQNMLDMKKLDSLMRESQRINPVGECKLWLCSSVVPRAWPLINTGTVTFRRVVKKPITLSDGFELKPGQQIGIAARCINTDDEFLPDAEKFSPLRWTKHQQAAPTLFTNSSAANLHFGLGRYACPGRFLASVRTRRLHMQSAKLRQPADQPFHHAA